MDFLAPVTSYLGLSVIWLYSLVTRFSTSLQLTIHSPQGVSIYFPVPKISCLDLTSFTPVLPLLVLYCYQNLNAFRLLNLQPWIRLLFIQSNKPSLVFRILLPVIFTSHFILLSDTCSQFWHDMMQHFPHISSSSLNSTVTKHSSISYTLLTSGNQ